MMKKSNLFFCMAVALIASMMVAEPSFASERKNVSEPASAKTEMIAVMRIDSVIVTEQNKNINNLLYTTESEGSMDILKYLSKNIVYPSGAINNGTEGYVKVFCTVEKSGAISQVKILEGNDEELSNAVVKTLKGVRFQPIMQYGHPTKYSVIFPVRFKLI